MLKTIRVILHPLAYQKKFLLKKAESIPEDILPKYEKGKYCEGSSRIINNEIQAIHQTFKKKKMIRLDKQISSIIRKNTVLYLKFQKELIPIRIKAVDRLDNLLLNHYNSSIVWYDCGFQQSGWRADIQVEVENKYIEGKPEAVIGIDLGMRHTCYSILVEGKEIYRAFDKYGKTHIILNNLKRLIAKKQSEFQGSRNQLSEYLKPFYEKRKAVLRQYYGTLRNKILKHVPEGNNAVFVLEDLNELPRNTLRKRQREWMCLELGNGIFREQLEYNGYKVVLVIPRNTTHQCSRCGTLWNGNPSDRKMHCKNCGLILDRDLNGARNIARRYMLSSSGKHTCIPENRLSNISYMQSLDNREKLVKESKSNEPPILVAGRLQ